MNRAGQLPLTIFIAFAVTTLSFAASAGAQWNGFAHDSQHSADSTVGADALNRVIWSTPVDLDPQTNGILATHYGSPMITAANTVIVPVKTGATGGFRVDARNAADGSLLWTLPTDYVAPALGEIPVFGPVLTSPPRLYFPGIGGTVYFRDNPDAACSGGGACQNQLAFFGMKNYKKHRKKYNSRVLINSPLSTDSAGDIYFGFVVTRPNGAIRDARHKKLQSGIARIDAGGNGTWIAVSIAAADTTMTGVAPNCAPAFSPDLKTLYVAVSDGRGGYLVALDSTTLAPIARVRLKDPVSGADATLPSGGSASPTVGPDGDVYFGVLENPCCAENHHRGFLLHFSAALAQSKAPGAFGWDTTPSIVPSSAIPSYSGPSSYLLATKYNNYVDAGGGGLNKVAVLDPDATETDPVTGLAVMNEIETILGPTPADAGGVKEWCINSAAVDLVAGSIMANSEDGKLYRWDLATNTLSQSVMLTTGYDEAYTPTVIGVDGAAYAIQNGILFAVGN
ncbi:MAG: hypothetical protein ACREQH_01940 [Candidatus Binatus sp.]